MMAKVAVFLFLALTSIVKAEYCFNEVAASCGVAGGGEDLNCSASYSGAHNVFSELSDYVNHHVNHSFQHLLMATNFANHEKNREGFSKLYKKLSDDSWEDAIDLIKYITKRGGTVRFSSHRLMEPNKKFENNFEMHEMESLGRALDMHKHLAETGHSIHAAVTKHRTGYHDAETISYLEKEFVHKHADTIRQLSGYTSDLSQLIKHASDPSLSVYLFDEYLQSTV